MFPALATANLIMIEATATANAAEIAGGGTSIVQVYRAPRVGIVADSPPSLANVLRTVDYLLRIQPLQNICRQMLR